jgi:hypothetical protein
MKRIFILMITLAVITNASCQENKRLLDYFPDLPNKDTIIVSWQLFAAAVRCEIEIDTTMALKYFFNNDVNQMHDIDVGSDMEENIWIYTPYTKKVEPLYKVKEENTYLLCYSISSVVYLAMYDYKNDTLGDVFIVVDETDDYGNTYTRSTIFFNNYILTVEAYEKAYYILSKIDYETRKFIELKKIETKRWQGDKEIIDNAYEALGISKTGELLEDNP